MSDAPNRVVIVGAGQAAAQLVLSLRQGGFSGDIRMIGDEPYPPYQRPPLSKTFLKERPAPDSLYFRPAAFWAEQGATLDLGVAVQSIDRGGKRVVLADGREVAFDALALVTGTRARELPLPGVALPGVFSLRKIDDIVKLRPALDTAERVVIAGGGYIGLEVAATVRQEERAATVLEAEERVMKRVTSPVISEFVEKFHRGRGVDIRLGARLAAIEGKGRVQRAKLASGETLSADLVLVAVGARANDDLAAAAGLACESS